MDRFALVLMIATAAGAAGSGIEAAPAPQADTPAARHEAAIAHIKKLAADISARSLADVATPADWRDRRASVRRELLYALGLDPLPRRTPLEAKVAGIVRRPGYRVEKVVFQSLPRLYVTANFYLPETPVPQSGQSAKLPTITECEMTP